MFIPFSHLQIESCLQQQVQYCNQHLIFIIYVFLKLLIYQFLKLSHTSATKGIMIAQIDSSSTLQNRSVQMSEKIEQSLEEQKEQILTQIKCQIQKRQHSYRGDIDGLRMIAVSIVVIFHAWPQFLPGGYIGVDIFFVISGYLITGILLKQNLKGQFSYFNFYDRRIKRIYPALLSVLIFVLAIGTKKLEQEALETMTKTMAASTVFGANIQILTYKQGYFGPEIKKNPLLHLWSLGVQEQFYIIWPLIISIIVKKFSSKAFILLSVFTIISFIANIFMAYIDTKLDFYLPFTRFWQMAVGGVLASQNIKINSPNIANVLSFLGISAILVTMWFIDESSLFPGWWALIPTLSAAAIIQAGNQSFINKHFLSIKLITFIGKISYSLYLWHWPLLVFSRIFYPPGSLSPLGNTYYIVIISILLSIVSYYLIESPLRFRKSKLVFFILLTVMLMIGITAVLINQNATYFRQRSNKNQELLKQYQIDMIPTEEDYYSKNGKELPNSSKKKIQQPPTVSKLTIVKQLPPWRQRSKQILLQKKIDKTSKYSDQEGLSSIYGTHYEVANEGRDNVLLLVGDSHAIFTAAPRLNQLYKQAVQNNKAHEFPTIVCIVRVSTTFLPDEDITKFTLNWIENFKPTRILFVYRWTAHWFRYHSQGKQDYYDLNNYSNLNEFFNIVKSLREKNISIISSTFKHQNPALDPANMVDQSGVIQSNIQAKRLSWFRLKWKNQIEFFETNMNNLGVKLIDFSDNQCFQDICEVLTPTGYPTHIDHHHHEPIFSKNWITVIDQATYF